MLLKLFRIILVSTLLLQGEAWAQPRLIDNTLPKLTVIDPTGANTTIDSLKITKPYVLTVLDTNVANSKSVLDAMKASGFDGEGVVVILIKSLANTDSVPSVADLEQYRYVLPKATWFWGTVPTVMQVMNISASPVFLGIGGQQKIIWRTIGLPKPSEKFVEQIRGWITPSGNVSNNSLPVR